MNKKMFEDFHTNQKILECDKQTILLHMKQMQEFSDRLPNGLSEETKRNSDLFIAEVKKDMETLAAEQKQVIAAINSLEDIDMQYLMKYRYVDGLPMPLVEKKMKLSHRTAYRRLNAAFEALCVA